MTTATVIDRAAIFRDAWALAREAAARAGDAVRLYLGNALRMAWGRFRIRPSAKKLKTAVQVLHEQIGATDEAVCGLQESISWATLDERVALVAVMKQALGTLEDQGVNLRDDLTEISPVVWQATPCQQQQANAANVTTPIEAAARHIRYASSLTDLWDALEAYAELCAAENIDLDEGVVDMNALPTFGGDRPVWLQGNRDEDVKRIWSWDTGLALIEQHTGPRFSMFSRENVLRT